jgi:hypothetical protein
MGLMQEVANTVISVHSILQTCTDNTVAVLEFCTEQQRNEQTAAQYIFIYLLRTSGWNGN